MARRIYFQLPGILWACFMLVLCGIPGNNFPRISFWAFLPLDKLVHFFLFSGFSFLLLVGLTKELDRLPGIRAYIVVLLLSLFYGIIIEVLQETVFINRSYDILDLLADLAGAMLGCAAFFYIGRKYRL